MPNRFIIVLACILIASLSSAADRKFFDETKATTLFAFDDVSIPFSQNLKLVMRAPERHSANPVVGHGGPKAPDSWAVQFYGSVIREGEKFRMWYVAASEDRVKRIGPRSSPWRVAYAESRDGVNWIKPKLGLVPLTLTNDEPQIFVNAHGLGSEAALELDLLRHDLTLIPGFSATIRNNGFQVPVKWKNPGKLADKRVRLRTRFVGKRKSDIRLHAFYLSDELRLTRSAERSTLCWLTR